MPSLLDDKNIGLLDHLEELRWRIIKSLGALIIGFIIGYIVAEPPLNWLVRPLAKAQEQVNLRRGGDVLQIEVAEDGGLTLRNPEVLQSEGTAPPLIAFFRPGASEPLHTYSTANTPPIIYLKPTDPFMIRCKMALVLGLVFAMPVILFQIWAFVAPGLLRRERRLVLPLLFFGSFLFPIGATFAYFVLEATLRFFGNFVLQNAAMQNDARAYLSFVLTMMVAFGIVFEMPLAVVLATRVGLLNVDWLAQRRPYIFIGLLCAAAILTPGGDPFSLLAMALPLQVLFEVALIVSRVLDRISPRQVDEHENSPEGMAT